MKKVIINPPSNILHISNLKTDACNYEIMFEILKKFGKVEAIKFKVLDHYKNMCLVRFNKLEESIAAMASLHDLELFKRFFFRFVKLRNSFFMNYLKENQGFIHEIQD